jgi:hypothetical protein
MTDARSEIARELSPNEHILWTGRPRQGIFLRTSDTFLIPFSILWAGFAVFWEFGVNASGAPLFFRLWGVPFVLVGVYLVIGRFFVDARARENTYYGITDERVIVVSGLRTRQVKSLQLRTLSDVSLSEQNDRRGTIMLGPLPAGYRSYAFAGWPGMSSRLPPSFEMIENARAVYEILTKAQRDGR